MDRINRSFCSRSTAMVVAFFAVGGSMLCTGAASAQEQPAPVPVGQPTPIDIVTTTVVSTATIPTAGPVQAVGALTTTTTTVTLTPPAPPPTVPTPEVPTTRSTTRLRAVQTTTVQRSTTTLASTTQPSTTLLLTPPVQPSSTSADALEELPIAVVNTSATTSTRKGGATTTTSSTTTTSTSTTSTTTTTTTTTRPPMLPLFRDNVGEAVLADQQKVILADQQNRRTALSGQLVQLRSDRTQAQQRIVEAQAKRGASIPKATKPATLPSATSTSLSTSTSVTATSSATTEPLGSTSPPSATGTTTSGAKQDLVVARRIAMIADHVVHETELGLAQIDLETRLVQSPAVEWFQGFVNPVQQPYSTSDSFGAPRTGHKHEGIDVFADRGTPVRATVNGALRDVKKTRIGGRIAYITSADGTYYYYAHLDRWAPGIADGQTVVAGQILGFVGRTGNAEATPPHLHFEIHPLGGPPLNPWLIIRATQKRDKESFARHTVTVSELCRLVADDDKRRAAFTATSIADPTATATSTQADSSSTTSTTIAPGVCPRGRKD